MDGWMDKWMNGELPRCSSDSANLNGYCPMLLQVGISPLSLYMSVPKWCDQNHDILESLWLLPGFRMVQWEAQTIKPCLASPTGYVLRYVHTYTIIHLNEAKTKRVYSIVQHFTVYESDVEGGCGQPPLFSIKLGASRAYTIVFWSTIQAVLCNIKCLQDVTHLCIVLTHLQIYWSRILCIESVALQSLAASSCFTWLIKEDTVLAKVAILRIVSKDVKGTAAHRIV